MDSLNDQIVQYIFAQNNVDLDLEKDLSPRERETLKSSMVLIRGLLIDAQSKFRKMVDDNRQLAVKIDGSIQAANQEVNVLRAELADTNKRLSQITLTNDLKVEKATQSESDSKFDSVTIPGHNAGLMIPSLKGTGHLLDLELMPDMPNTLC